MPQILEELQKYGKKKSHGIWWIMPTEKPGDNEPGHPSSLQIDEMKDIFE